MRIVVSELMSLDAALLRAGPSARGGDPRWEPGWGAGSGAPCPCRAAPRGVVPGRARCGHTGGVELAAGIAGIALSWGLAGAQWWRSRRSAAGISAQSWGVFLAVNATWVVYALGVSNPYLLLNGLGAGACNVALLRRVDPRRARTFATVAVATVGAAALGSSVGWGPVAAWCVLMAAWLRWPQVAELLRAPDVQGVSLASWVLASANNAVWIVVAAERDDAWLLAANVVLGLSSLAVVALCVWRRAGAGAVVGAAGAPSPSPP